MKKFLMVVLATVVLLAACTNEPVVSTQTLPPQPIQNAALDVVTVFSEAGIDMPVDGYRVELQINGQMYPTRLSLDEYSYIGVRGVGTEAQPWVVVVDEVWGDLRLDLNGEWTLLSAPETFQPVEIRREYMLQEISLNLFKLIEVNEVVPYFYSMSNFVSEQEPRHQEWRPFNFDRLWASNTYMRALIYSFGESFYPQNSPITEVSIALLQDGSYARVQVNPQ